MTIKENDTTASVPRFKTSELKDVRQWLIKQNGIATKNGGPLFAEQANVQIALNDQQQTERDSSWKFSANVGIPIDWFWLGGSTNDSGSTQFKEDYSYDILITYQDVITVNINPGIGSSKDCCPRIRITPTGRRAVCLQVNRSGANLDS